MKHAKMFYSGKGRRSPVPHGHRDDRHEGTAERGLLDDLDSSEEINTYSMVVTANIDGREEQWLVMFKNETHNHPTEIEPFGGAATCLGGAIRDPLSGRSMCTMPCG